LRKGQRHLAEQSPGVDHWQANKMDGVKLSICKRCRQDIETSVMPRYKLRTLLLQASPWLALFLLLLTYPCLLRLAGMPINYRRVFVDSITAIGVFELLTLVWYPLYRLVMYRLRISVHRSGEVRRMDMFDLMQVTAIGTFVGTLLIPLGQTLRQ
jgi:hypothetical protein